MIDQLAQQSLIDRFPESIQRILANQLGLDFIDRSKNRDPRFRDIVLRAYHSRCAFCGYDLRLDGALVSSPYPLWRAVTTVWRCVYCTMILLIWVHLGWMKTWLYISRAASAVARWWTTCSGNGTASSCIFLMTNHCGPLNKTSAGIVSGSSKPETVNFAGIIDYPI